LQAWIKAEDSFYSIIKKWQHEKHHGKDPNVLSDLELKINEQREIWIFGNFSVLVEVLKQAL